MKPPLGTPPYHSELGTSHINSELGTRNSELYENPPLTEESRIHSGQLWERLCEAGKRGHKSGALVPLSTTYTWIEDSGLRFQVRLLESLQKKDAVKAIQVASKESPRPTFNPFLPYEADLFVGDICESHAVVLNKYKVIDHHMLVITRDFQPQTDLLTEDDFSAMVLCLGEMDGLAFYNGGELAGSSQPHKHLQLLPLPLTPDAQEPPFPIEPWIREVITAPGVTEHPSLPFVHAIQSQQETWSLPSSQRALAWQQSYHRLLQQTGLWTESSTPSGPQPGAYNLLATRDWMMLVPRSQEFYQRISINSLGFVGGLLARTPKEVQQIQDIGPLNLLQHVAIPKKANA